MQSIRAHQRHSSGDRSGCGDGCGVVRGRFGCAGGALCTSLRRAVRYCAEHSGHSHDVARGHGEFEVLVHTPEASIQCLPDSPNGLAPAEVFFDALADRLADRVARMPCGSPVDGAAADARVVARHVRRHAPASAGIDEVTRVIGLVCRDRLGVAAGHGVEHRQRCRSLAHAVSVSDDRTRL